MDVCFQIGLYGKILIASIQVFNDLYFSQDLL